MRDDQSRCACLADKSPWVALGERLELNRRLARAAQTRHEVQCDLRRHSPGDANMARPRRGFERGKGWWGGGGGARREGGGSVRVRGVTRAHPSGKPQGRGTRVQPPTGRKGRRRGGGDGESVPAAAAANVWAQGRRFRSGCAACTRARPATTSNGVTATAAAAAAAAAATNFASRTRAHCSSKGGLS